MRKFKLELWKDNWTMLDKKPSKTLYFKSDVHCIRDAEKLAQGFEQMRLLEYRSYYKDYETVMSGSVD